MFCHITPSFKYLILYGVGLIYCVLLPTILYAADIPQAGLAELELPAFTTQLIVLSLLSLVPFAIVLFSSYIKTSIVLSLLRNAIGVQQAPPNLVLNGLSLIIALYVMYPTLELMYIATKQISPIPDTDITTTETHTYIIKALDVAKEPLRSFLILNTHITDINTFRNIAQESMQHIDINDNSFVVVMPSFVLTQIREAFIMGALIYLPFFIIDIVVSNILLALGMMMMSPLAIALPVKLGVMVMTNGWISVITSIIKSFSHPTQDTVKAYE